MKQQLLHKLASCPQLQQHLQSHQFADFCRQLQEDEEVLDARSALELLDLFCQMCWRLDDLQKPCYESVSALWKNSSTAAKTALIPKLIEQSFVYNDFVFLAQEFLENPSSYEKKMLGKIYPPHWTTEDEYSSICEAEYKYRQAKGLECWIYKYPPLPSGKITIDYQRPSCVHDFRCFEAILKVLHLAGQPIYMYCSGWND